MVICRGRGALFAALALFAACASSTAPSSGSPTAPPGGATAVNMSVQRDLDASVVDTVRHDVRIFALITDASTHAPAPGVLVNWHVVGMYDGAVYTEYSLSNADGIARQIWTLGPYADTQTVEARAIDASSGDPLVLAQFQIKAVAGSFNYFTLDTVPIEVFVNHKVNVRERIGQQGFDGDGNPVSSGPSVSITADSNWIFVGDSAYSPVATHVAIRYSAGTWSGQIAAAADSGGPGSAARRAAARP
jgi:hypothetical protein